MANIIRNKLSRKERFTKNNISLLSNEEYSNFVNSLSGENLSLFLNYMTNLENNINESNNVSNDVSKQILLSCKKGDDVTLSSLLDSYPQYINIKDKNGNTPLIYAIKYNHFKCVNVLLNKEGINIDLPNDKGEYPINIALHREPFILVKQKNGINNIVIGNISKALLEKGAYVLIMCKYNAFKAYNNICDKKKIDPFNTIINIFIKQGITKEWFQFFINEFKKSIIMNHSTKDTVHKYLDFISRLYRTLFASKINEITLNRNLNSLNKIIYLSYPDLKQQQPLNSTSNGWTTGSNSGRSTASSTQPLSKLSGRLAKRGVTVNQSKLRLTSTTGSTTNFGSTLSNGSFGNRLSGSQPLSPRITNSGFTVRSSSPKPVYHSPPTINRLNSSKYATYGAYTSNITNRSYTKLKKLANSIESMKRNTNKRSSLNQLFKNIGHEKKLTPEQKTELNTQYITIKQNLNKKAGLRG